MAEQVMSREIRGLWRAWPALAFIFPLVMAVTGCEQPQQSMTYNKDVVVFPFYDLHRTEGVTADGVKWQKEKGDSCLLAWWDKEKRYDKDGFLVYRKETSVFIPFGGSTIEEDPKSLRKEGSVLLLPYKSYRDKTAAPK
jgi:hypothetical protein